MINRSGGLYGVVCNKCPDSSTERFEDYFKAVECAKKLGWICTKDADGDRIDICTECQKEG